MQEYGKVVIAFIRSLLSALIIATLVLLFSVHVVAPGLPRVVGDPAVDRDRALILQDARMILVANRSGNVRVMPTDGTEATVHARIRIYERTPADGEEALDYADQLLTVVQEGPWMAVRCEPEERPDNLEVRTDLEVRVPRDVSLLLQVEHGNVWAGPGVGALTVQGRNADVTVDGTEGELVVETLNGRIRVNEAMSGANLTTVNGSVFVRISGGVLDARTTNGAIVAHLQTPDVERCVLQNDNGGVTATLPEGVGATLDIATDQGAIRCDHPLSGPDVLSTRRRLQGVVHDGAVDLRVRALNGNVWIARGASGAPWLGGVGR